MLGDRFLDRMDGGGNELVARTDDAIIRGLNRRQLAAKVRHDVLGNQFQS